MWSKFVGQLNPIFGAAHSVTSTTPLKITERLSRKSSVGSQKDPRVTEARRKSSLLYGVALGSEISVQEKLSEKQFSRKTIRISAEQQQELCSLFRQWQGALDEKERDVLLIALSRKFFENYVDAPDMVGESLDDLELFTDAVSRHLINCIRLQSSQDILQMLADENQLFFILKTIDLLCNGPVSIHLSQHNNCRIDPRIEMLVHVIEFYSDDTKEFVFEIMTAHSLPIIMIKAFQSFIEIPQHTIKSESNEQADLPSSNSLAFAPSGVVSDIVTDILIHFVINSITLNQMLEQDVLYLLVTMVINDRISILDNKEHQYIWEDRAMEVLIELFAVATQDIIKYFIDKNVLGILMKILTDSLDLKSNTFIGGKQLIYAENFLNMDGYEIFFNLLILPPFDGLYSEAKDALIEMVEDLAFTGAGEIKPVISNRTPYQHNDFQLPNEIKDDENLFRNERAFQVLSSTLLYPDSKYIPPFLLEFVNTIIIKEAIPDIFQQKIVAAIAEIYKANVSNFFLTEHLNTLPTLIQELDRFNVKVQRSILDLLVYVMVDLNYVPFRELVVLSLHFQGHSLRHTTAIVCETVISLLQTSSKFKEDFREIGLLDMLCNLLQELATTLHDRFGDTHFVRRISVSQSNDTLNTHNNKASKTKSRLNGALTIFETLVVEGYLLSNAEPHTPMTTCSRNSTSSIEHSFQFGRLIEIVQSLPRFDLKMKRHILLSMKRILVSCPEMKDVFRESGGFVCLVSLLVGLEDVYKQLIQNSVENDVKIDAINADSQIDYANYNTDITSMKTQAIDTLKAIFVVFAEAMSNHDSNRRFFSNSIGFKSVEDAICLTEMFNLPGAPENLFGILFGFAIENDSVADAFIDRQDISNNVNQFKIEELFGNFTDEIHNPDIIPTIMKLQLCVNRDSGLFLKIYEALVALAFANRRNQVMLNKSGVLEIVLHRLFPTSIQYTEKGTINASNRTQEKKLLTKLAQRLIEMGVTTKEIRFLFEQFENGNQRPKAITDTDGAFMTAMDMVLFGVQRSRWPRFIQFDMCQFGYSCLEMNSLSDRPFPPVNGGYTFMSWLDIENFDSEMNLTLLGLSDDEKKCYLQIYFEAQTHKLVVQTSPKQTTRFDNFEFRTGYWYHIALVHRRSRLGQSSLMSLYVDGRFVDEQKCPYLNQSVTNRPIKTFIGTPKDIAKKLGKGETKLAWDLGPCYFFEDDLDGDIISVYCHLGPRYSSNFQDSLGQFQTYQTSTLLNMRLEALSRQRGDSTIELDNLPIVNAIRGNNSQTLPEEKIIFAFNASNVLVCGQNASILGAGLSEGTSQALLGNVNTKVILNAAVPKVERALRVPHGLAYLQGDPVTAVPYGMDDSIWKIGGSSVVLRLIERAETTEDLYKTVCTLIELIRFNWRNSEDMERIHGYEILAYLLKQKHGLLTPELLNLLLVFVGLNPVNHMDSVIMNPLAYRFLILDFDLWRHSPESVQRAHLQQFSIFIHLSKHHHYNAKRLSKMHVVKKMLVALKTNVYPKELLTDFIETLKIVVKYNFTTEVIRSIVTFLVSTLNKPSPIRRGIRKESPLKTGSTTTFSHESIYGKASVRNIIVDVRSLPAETTARHIGVMVMEMLTDIVCDKLNPFYVNRFATTITNKWPLLFFSEDSNPSWVVCAARILARLFHSQGAAYINKFRTLSEGFIVMQKLLPQWWYLTQLQHVLFTMLFGIDVCDISIDASFDLSSLVTLFRADDDSTRIACPDVMIIILLMMKEGINSVVQLSYEVERGHKARDRSKDDFVTQNSNEIFEAEKESDPLKETLFKVSHVEQIIIHFLMDMYNNSSEFSELCCKGEIMDCFIEILFPIVCACDEVPIETELCNKDLGLSFDVDTATDLFMNSINNNIPGVLPVLANLPRYTQSFDDETGEEMIIFSTGNNIATILTEDTTISPSASPTQASPVNSDIDDEPDSNFRIKPPTRRMTKKPDYSEHKNATVESLLEFVVSLCVNSVVDPKLKPLAGLEIVLRSFPPSLLEHQACLFNSCSLKITLQLDSNLLTDQRIIANVARFSQMAVDAIYQGWFSSGRDQMYEFITAILERIDETNGKRVNDQWIAALYRSLDRMILFKLSEIENTSADASIITEVLEKLIYNQRVILSPYNTDVDFLRCLCYHLYKFLIYDSQDVKTNSTNVWKMLMLQKPNEIPGILRMRVRGMEYKELVEGFNKLLEMDINSFLDWVESRRTPLDTLFHDNISKIWYSFVASEVKNCKEYLRNLQNKRMNKLKKLFKRATVDQEFFNQYRVKTTQWSRNIQEVETSRYYKSIQDNIDHDNYVRDEWAKTSADLFRERALWGPKTSDHESKWRLDFTEGRCRMRKKLEQNEDSRLFSYKPKSSKYENYANDNTNESSKSYAMNNSNKSHTSTCFRTLKYDRYFNTLTNIKFNVLIDLDVPIRHLGGKPHDRQMTLTPSASDAETSNDDVDSVENSQYTESQAEADEENAFEEDKNRKVLRSLEHGDAVLDIFNISRIAGLDACEGLLLLCKQNLYLIDNYFQTMEGEIVDIWDAPTKERDQYLQMLASHAGYVNNTPSKENKHKSRRWAFDDIKEVHKRKFLFRDVALEIFFADGRNYLITFFLKERDIAYNKLVARATFSISGAESVIGTSVLDAVSPVTPLTIPSTGLRFNLSFFSNSNSSLAELTLRWEKREISNFQYLMHLNTLAGRSYNDLTQYPVFPWILADYTSEDLDLSNPATFRDLSKPMGAQTEERKKELQIRYRSFDPTANATTPAFHYGTHYSSAMIVCSYLIRLEPFTQQYLKLQGGHFDHADRLFHSIAKAWLSATRDNMSDVRELIPEFFYLPEFLENANKFNFGVKQGTGEVIDSVILPPWAYDDPKMFIHKHRQALECEYVSAHLHEWIDLIFGYKQQGQPAVDAVNVFHHLSYEGAIDLDAISDPVERSATTGIIHNFGQTPRQLFTRPHPPRSSDTSDSSNYKFNENMEMLIQSISPLLDIRLQVHDIRIANDRLFAVSTQQMLVPPNYTYYVEWGYSDNSLRLHQTDTKKLIGLYENLHLQTVSCACFADGRTFITGGTDAVICIWRFKWQPKSPECGFMECLRGHSAKINCVTNSRSYSVIISGSDDKTCIIWDLNRMKYVRQLQGHETGVQFVAINDTTGDIATCSGSIIRLWSINGDLLVTKNTAQVPDPILCCTFYEGKQNEWFDNDIIITGHKKGIWNKNLKVKEDLAGNKACKWNLELRHQSKHENRIEPSPVADVVALLPAGTQRVLYSGDSSGKVYSWTLPDTKIESHWMLDGQTDSCLKCSVKFAREKFIVKLVGVSFVQIALDMDLIEVQDFVNIVVQK
ncbi:14997_t:CDS:10 [Cetraspora pellucida]|uniref:14997_t:CDS:1 n=1 Tax=Cetraspora pellucida TaxID=1433469 RepID=A0ACA9K0S2_9GLOM|nr:14997_t:CDS:10 [Cetraspora pellucida]